MDIWRWIYAKQEELRETGNDRLADLLEQLPEAAIADQDANVEAMVPEALALSRALDDPWVEIFVRHWYRQMRGGGRSELPDAVELFELAHRDDNVDCPQSVCVVQDLAIAYAGADPRAYATQRLDVSAETLRRIDPSWQCFACISSEHSDALRDLDRHDEALAFEEQQRRAAADAGGRWSSNELLPGAADSLVALGRAAEALERLDAADAEDGGRASTSFGRKRRQARAVAHLAIGDLEAAAAAALPFEEIAGTRGYEEDWARVAEGLVAGPWTNDWALGTQLEELLTGLVAAGRPRQAIGVAGAHARLALGRDARATADRAVTTARSQLPLLAADLGATAEIDELATTVLQAAAVPVELPQDATALVALLDAEDEDGAPTTDPERQLELLTAARERWPDDEELPPRQAWVAGILGRPDDAVAILRAWFDANPEHPHAALDLGGALIDAGRDAEVLALAEKLDERDAAVDADWLRAQLAFERDDHDAAADAALRVARADPEAHNARRLAIEAALEAGRWRDVLDCAGELLALEPDDETGLWASVTAATPVGDWETVRGAAAKIGMELGGTGPVDECWELVEVQQRLDEALVAMRTGPATARIIEVTQPSRPPQRAGTVVLLAPVPVSAPDDDDKLVVKRALTELDTPAMRTVELDGLHPGDDRWRELRATLHEHGWFADRRAGAAYRVGEGDDEALGFYAWAALPAATSDAAAHALLTDATASWGTTFVIWPELARASGDEAAARAHLDLAARYAIEVGGG